MAKIESGDIVNIALFAGLAFAGYKIFKAFSPNDDSGGSFGGGGSSLPLTYDQLQDLPNAPTLKQISASNATAYQKFSSLRTAAGDNISPFGPLGDAIPALPTFSDIGDFFSGIFGGSSDKDTSKLIYRPDVNPTVLFEPKTGQAVASTQPQLFVRSQASANPPSAKTNPATVPTASGITGNAVRTSFSSTPTSSGGGGFSSPAYSPSGKANFTLPKLQTPNIYYTPAPTQSLLRR